MTLKDQLTERIKSPQPPFACLQQEKDAKGGKGGIVCIPNLENFCYVKARKRIDWAPKGEG